MLPQLNDICIHVGAMELKGYNRKRMAVGPKTTSHLALSGKIAGTSQLTQHEPETTGPKTKLRELGVRNEEGYLIRLKSTIKSSKDKQSSQERASFRFYFESSTWFLASYNYLF